MFKDSGEKKPIFDTSTLEVSRAVVLNQRGVPPWGCVERSEGGANLFNKKTQTGHRLGDLCILLLFK